MIRRRTQLSRQHHQSGHSATRPVRHRRLPCLQLRAVLPLDYVKRKVRDGGGGGGGVGTSRAAVFVCVYCQCNATYIKYLKTYESRPFPKYESLCTVLDYDIAGWGSGKTFCEMSYFMVMVMVKVMIACSIVLQQTDESY